MSLTADPTKSSVCKNLEF